MLKDGNKFVYILFFIFLILFALITSKGLVKASPGDENVYFYMGKLISEGKLPYKDFFYAHPPLHIYLISIIYGIFGFNIIALKLVPLISILVTSFFVFKISKEKFGSAEAVISSLLFLFSYSVMFNSVFDFGVNLAVMFLMMGVYLLYNRNSSYAAGIFFALAGLTRLLALIPIFVILIFVLLSRKERFFKLSTAFLGIFLFFNVVFMLIAGSNYIEFVYKYHLQKSLGLEQNFREYSDIVKLNWILFVAAFSFIFVKNKKPINIFIIISAVYLLFLLILKKLFGFYFIIAFPFLAIIGSYSLVEIYKKFNISKKIMLAILSIITIMFLWNLASDVLFLEKVGFVAFDRGADLIEYIKSHSDQNTQLFGDESIVPLLALSSGRNIALDFIDTNNEIFISGIKNINEILNNLKGKATLFVIRSSQGLSYFAEVRDFLNSNCELLSTFHDKIEGDFLIYKCK